MESKTSSSSTASASESDDGIHMQLLEKALEKTTRKCVSSFKLMGSDESPYGGSLTTFNWPTLFEFSSFRRQFEPIYKTDPTALQQLHDGAAAELTSNIQEELRLMFEEENIREFMAKLDQMKVQADGIAEDVTAWRPSGNPTDDVRAHVQPIHRQHLHQLQKVFDQLQSQNTLLQRSLKKHHDKMMQSRSAMVDYLDTWKKANCLTAEDRQEVENFVKLL